MEGDTGGRSQGPGLLGGGGEECGFCSEVDEPQASLESDRM